MKKIHTTVRKKKPSIQHPIYGDLLQRITVDPKILTGKPTIRGMRISVEHVLNLLGHGMTNKEMREQFPFLEEEDIHAAVAYAGQS